MTILKSPLRYPGGKSRAIQQIKQFIPEKFNEYREPFVGGGSIFIYIRQNYPNVSVWINDLNYDLYCFWLIAQQDSESLSKCILKIKERSLVGRELFEHYREPNSNFSEFERAVRFFILNRITFSGLVDSGGYSELSFKKRFTLSSIKRLQDMKEILSGVRITCLDYSEVIKPEGEKVFIFLDPPYLKATKSHLYGKKGHLHVSFDHRAFATEMNKVKNSKWLITYDNSAKIRKNFSFANNIHRWKLQYGMNNYKQVNAKKGNELFISNYIPPGGTQNKNEKSKNK